MLRVVVERAGEVLRDTLFRKDLVSFGRDAANDVVLEDPLVSARHAIVKREGDTGPFRLLDQSFNGTFFEGERVSNLRIQTPIVLRISEFSLTLIPITRTGTVAAVDPYASTAVDVEIPSEPEIVTAPYRAVAGPGAIAQAELRSISTSGELKLLVFSDTALIGRSSEADLQFSSREISRRHALITVGPSGYQIRRLSTKNVIEVNGRQVGRGETMPLRDGDVIKMCDEEIVFLYPATHSKDDSPDLPREASPNLDLAVSRRGCSNPSITAVDVVGFLGTKTIQRFETAILEYAKSTKKLLVDLGYLVGVDGAGVASLARVIRECEEHGVNIQLIRMNGRIADSLAFSSLQPILNVYIANTEDTAIRRLGT